MKYPAKNDVKRIGPVARVLAAFILLCSFLAGAGLVFAVVTEPFQPLMLLGVAIIGIMLHVSGSIVFRGHAPKYLLFAHGAE